MAKAKITITGETERAPKINSDGTADLLFKIPMSEQVPKGLKSLGESVYLVHVSAKAWKKVSDQVKTDSFFIVQGESKANKTQSGTPVIEVVCFDLSLKEDSKNTESLKEENKLAIIQDKEPAAKKQIDLYKKDINSQNKDLNSQTDNKIKKEKPSADTFSSEVSDWYKNIETIQVSTEDILIKDPMHLNATKLALNGLLKAAYFSGKINRPIVIKPDENGKYALVMGLRQYTVAKMLNIPELSAVIKDTTHDELIKEMRQIE